MIASRAMLLYQEHQQLSLSKGRAEKVSEEQRKRLRDLQQVPLHQTAMLSPPKKIEIKKKYWWQYLLKWRFHQSSLKAPSRSSKLYSLQIN
jgi:hypothetical protein